MILGKDILRALRNANAVVFYHNEEDATTGKGRIAIIKEVEVDGYEKTDVRKEITLDSLIYNRSDLNRTYKYAHHHESIYCYGEGFKEAWHGKNNQFETILCMLKENDDISLYWYPDNNSENMRELGWHNDMLILCVKRKDKYLSFKIEEHPYLDNTARMITDRAYYCGE